MIFAARLSVTLLDLLIIYLACGSPFAVYCATTREAKDPLYRTWSVIVSLLIWPVFALSLLKSRIDHALSPLRTFPDLEKIRTTIEAQLFANAPSSSVFEFRDAFYRFAGLEAASCEKPSQAGFEIFKISGHPNTALASRILARNNLRKIDHHKARAHAELSEVLSLSSSTNMDAEIRDSITRVSPSFRFPEVVDRPTPLQTAISERV